MIEFTPEVIYKLEPNEVIVFSTNCDGKHKGLAKTCFQKFGATYGKSTGFSGQSYAITTRTENKKSPLSYIREQVEIFYKFSKENDELKFFVTKIGSEEFEIGDIAEIFMDYECPFNVILPKEFYDWTKM